MSSMLGLLLGESKEDFLSMGVAEAGPSFRPRTDGGFDYFPDGTSKRGYRVDPPTRNRIMRIRRGLDCLFFGLIATLVLAGFAVEPLLRGTYPFVLLFLAGGAIGGVVMLVARRGSRRMIQDLLRGALLVRRWKEVPRGRLLLGL